MILFNQKYINFFFLIAFIFINGSYSIAQNYIEGYVYDNNTKEPMEAVSIINTLSDKWTVSDKKGYFKVPFSEEYNIIFKILGKEEKIIEGISGKNILNLRIYLKDKDLRLEEVMVTAGGNSQDKVSSSIVLDKYAISQFQNFSLGEVLQQLPGGKIKPINLNSPKVISLRTANSTVNNRYGVSFILDDMPLSNDENMDSYYDIGSVPYSNINDGYDLRNIPSSNIEKVEVISGIADAKYGNATSGVIKIDRKAGISPYTMNARLNKGAFAASIDKGFKISDKWGRLSLSLDYLNSNADPRKNLENFNRVTASGIWSIINNRYKNTLSITLRSNFDELRVDKEFDRGTELAKHRKDKGFSINNRGNFNMKHKFLDYINYQVGAFYSKSETYRQSFINTGGKVAPVALKTALMPGVYTPVAYLHKQQIFSTPFNINGRISIGKKISYKSLSQKLSLGADFKYSDNVGKGKAYAPETAVAFITLSTNSTSGLGVRPLNFGEYVIPRRSLGVYIQDNLTYSFKNRQKLYANIGLRYDNQNGFSSFGPRINTAYELSKNIKIRGGIGFSSKAPSLANVFPGNKYYDILIRDIRTNFYSFNLVQTFVKEIPINYLEPSKIWKYEIGTDIKTTFANLKITAYYNQMYDGFGSKYIMELRGLPNVKFEYPNGKNNPPTYSILGYSSYPIGYTMTKNGKYSIDKGVEFFINFKKIRSLNTSFSVIGQYTYTQISDVFPYLKKTEDLLEKEYVWSYYYKSPDKNDNLSFRIISTYHNSDLGLLISLTSEFFVQSVYYATANDIYPYAYKNINLEYKEIPEKERRGKKYEILRLNPISKEDKKFPFYSNYHLRITKEMLNGLSLSFYATNFLNYMPKVEINGNTKTPNSSISFGGSIKYIF